MPRNVPFITKFVAYKRLPSNTNSPSSLTFSNVQILCLKARVAIGRTKAQRQTKANIEQSIFNDGIKNL
jgi:hypothetical protein